MNTLNDYIICVDDEKIVLDSLKSELNHTFSKMLNIEIAESGFEALELINELLSYNKNIPIIIADWQMPEMKGDEFLIQVHKLLPDTRKILLTGQVTPEGIGNVVNNAKLYRYMGKPWEPEDLDLTVTNAYKSYHRKQQLRLQQKELKRMYAVLKQKVKNNNFDCEKRKKEVEYMLDQTLKASISALVYIMSSSHKLVYEKSLRMKELIKKIIPQFTLENVWEFEMASLLSQIGCIELDREIVERFFSGKELQSKELNVFKLHPMKGYDILKNIPRFENVAEGISYMFLDSKLADHDFKDTIQPMKIAKILRIAHDFDQFKIAGVEENEIISRMVKFQDLYDIDLIKAISFIKSDTEAIKTDDSIISVNVSGLRVGMILAAEIRDSEGKIILRGGDEVSQKNLMHLIQVKKKTGLREPFYVLFN